MMKATNITVRIGGRAILAGVDCAVPPGRVTVAMGKNGAGKSTLLNVLAGHTGADAGAVTVDGRGLKDYAPRALASRRAVLAQSHHLGFPLSVAEVVEIGCYGRYGAMTRRERGDRIAYYLDLLNLTALRERSFPTLSGGEQKRVLLAKCLLQLDAPPTVVPRETVGASPAHQYLLLDEPTAALDVAQQYRFLSLATALARDRGLGVFAILHDLNLAARFADDLIFLREGRLVAAGPKAAVLHQTTIRDTFDVDCLIQAHPHFDGSLITTMPYVRSNPASPRPTAHPPERHDQHPAFTP